MKVLSLACAVSAALLGAIAISGNAQAGPKNQPTFDWVTVVNNNDIMPGSGAGQGGGGHGGHGGEGGQGAQEGRKFNSYNQPSVNLDGLVVIRARSKGGMGGGQPTHGIYTRDMSDPDSKIHKILDRNSLVPDPNNLNTTFVETPSFPRIDMESDTIATRGNHQPVWRYVPDGETEETRAGTTGIYANPFGDLITGAAKLGNVTDFFFYEVPEFPGLQFEVFPGSPSVTGGSTIVFKGNYTVGEIGKTGVYFRPLENTANGGASMVEVIANNTDTLIPGFDEVFGSTSPPSAARGKAVFAGFDNEDAPTKGGIYLAPLEYSPRLTTLVSIGGDVPGEAPGATFNGLGEGGAFDGRFVGFWGAWGEQTKTVRLYCQTEGNKDRIAFCNQNLVCKDAGPNDPKRGDTNSICPTTPDDVYGDRCYQERDVPVNQGFFVTDTQTGKTRMVAKTGDQFDEFLFWNYSGKTPCTGGGHSEEGGEDDGEPARWRSSAFVAVAGRAGASYNAVFKARKGELVDKVWTDTVDGIYLRKGPGEGLAIETVLDTTTAGRLVDQDAPEESTVIELGLEREGLRGKWLAINATMGVEGGGEEDGMAGVYVTELP
jgi:hypothetical protein